MVTPKKWEKVDKSGKKLEKRGHPQKSGKSVEKVGTSKKVEK